MDEGLRTAIVEAVNKNSWISGAALTGSGAVAGRADTFSDLDLLVVAHNEGQVRDVRSWLPRRDEILACEFHQWHVCSVLWEGLDRLDMTIYGVSEPATDWVLSGYAIIKGAEEFKMELDSAVTASLAGRAVHEDPDVSAGNVVLLLATAAQRVQRGEELSAHAFLSAACDMVAALERRRAGIEPGADLLDSRRRVELSRPSMAAALHRSLFCRPEQGLCRLAEYVSRALEASLAPGHSRALRDLVASCRSGGVNKR